MDGSREGEGEREASHTGEPGLGKILTSARRAPGRLTFLHEFSPIPLLLFLSACPSPSWKENVNRMHSCLIVNLVSSARWPRAPVHVRSPTTLLPPPTQLLHESPLFWL